MWGTDILSCRDRPFLRFIPTHVGNRSAGHGKQIDFTVHPHACGEQNYKMSAERQHRGSSPRMWGTVLDNTALHDNRRFIPTHVGNSLPARVPEAVAAVHPHACGEQIKNIGIRNIKSGSSPRMWGTDRAEDMAERLKRFIPTHVGNSITDEPFLYSVPVHPHACGEQEKK